jgi:DNA-3-methyladenine glycosylase I
VRTTAPDGRPRCPWGRSPALLAYHDGEWGVPLHDDRGHFELLILEGAQAGLSWSTVLARRDGYRRAFADFDPAAVARFGQEDVERILAGGDVIRNRRKVESAVTNAAAFIDVAERFGGFDAYVWQFVDGTPRVGRFAAPSQVPASTPLSAALSADLRRRGFRFVGATICYAYLQAAGLVMDHLVGCYRYPELAATEARPT